jgi:hypothetical protein
VPTPCAQDHPRAELSNTRGWRSGAAEQNVSGSRLLLDWAEAELRASAPLIHLLDKALSKGRVALRLLVSAEIYGALVAPGGINAAPGRLQRGRSRPCRAALPQPQSLGQWLAIADFVIGIWWVALKIMGR